MSNELKHASTTKLKDVEAPCDGDNGLRTITANVAKFPGKFVSGKAVVVAAKDGLISKLATSVLQYQGTCKTAEVASFACKKQCGPLKNVLIRNLLSCEVGVKVGMGGKMPTNNVPACEIVPAIEIFKDKSLLKYAPNLRANSKEVFEVNTSLGSFRIFKGNNEYFAWLDHEKLSTKKGRFTKGLVSILNSSGKSISGYLLW
jgi:hypothetical protein